MDNWGIIFVTVSNKHYKEYLKRQIKKILMHAPYDWKTSKSCESISCDILSEIV